ncbi:hypothetical protein IL38_23815 [Actinopolyspora erythraea]|uniref:FAD dependent oxidoreductase domain-containing protein n=1 Tax=Actinopolyspora erythraea TaxID=414996 RepID=A0ABR4WY76_9ACTN|nr:FAD-dependent oxidoreductase [Actinopolyspora erythraea]KGI79339.1 hypothetical protein IL38_23815 [Actinopolyspora erythraea]
MHTIIVGAGIAGSSLARALRAAESTVTVVANPDLPEHSRAAAALLRSAYHAKHPGEDSLFHRSLDLYAHWGIDLLTGGLVTNYRTPGRAPRPDPDWYLLDPAAPLLAPDRRGHAAPTETGIALDGDELAADTVVWCTGAATGPATPRGTLTYGHTWTHPDPDVLTHPDALRIHHWAPYKTIAAGRLGTLARLGSSSAKHPATAEKQAHAMLATAVDTGIIRTHTGWTCHTGIRSKTETSGLIHTGGRHYALTGLHRTGYALAPALAADAAASLTTGRATRPQYGAPAAPHGG